MADDTAAKGVTVTEAFKSMKSADDSIAELDAMIPRLLKMKKQLIAQKEYIEVAVKLASGGKTSDTTGTYGTAAPYVLGAGQKNIGDANIIDYRVNLYKHRDMIAPVLKHDHADGNTGHLQDIATGANATASTGSDTAPPLSVKAIKDIITVSQGLAVNSGGSGRIFKANQFIDSLKKLSDGTTDMGNDDFGSLTAIRKAAAPSATDVDGHDPELQDGSASPVFNGVDLECTKNFLIGVNAILTHPNNITSSGLKTDVTASAAASTNYVISIKPGENTTTAATYSAGGKHALTDGTLRGLLMLTNTGVDANIMDFSPAVIPVGAAMKAHAAFMSTDATGTDGAAGSGGRLAANKKIRGFGL
jgi:hypothetical protein